MTLLLTSAEMRAADAAAIAAGVSSTALMEAAGAAVAQAVMARWTPRPVLVLCGPGNNGGDGFVAARHLREAGWPVTLALMEQATFNPDQTGRETDAPADTARTTLTDRQPERAQAARDALRGDAAWAAASWNGPVADWPAVIPPGTGLVIDAVFGTGLRAAPPPSVSGLLATASCPIVAVDVPSGLSGDGDCMGPVAAAALTVTFHRLKPAHVLVSARPLIGEVVLADIGIPDQGQAAATLTLNAPDLWRAILPWPRTASHKHNRGRLAVMAGPRHATGAARLAARAGARAGAGWTAIFATAQSADIIAAHETSLLVQVRREPSCRPGDRFAAVVFGPAAGLDARARDDLWALCEAAGQPEQVLVLDADALTLGSEAPARLWAALAARKAVLTPHEGEFARLFPSLPFNRIEGARTAARLSGAVVVRKGADTVIAAPDGRTCLNTHATPWLASAGTGDVLAGLIGGLCAGGMEPFEAACAATWIHGEAGLRVGPGLVAEDLLAVIPAVLNSLAPDGLKARSTVGQAGSE